MNTKIENPEHGTMVKHTGWQQHSDHYPSLIIIKEGTFLSNGRVSNFWYWKRLLDDGSLGPDEHGYGSFTNYKEEELIKLRNIRTLIKQI